MNVGYAPITLQECVKIVMKYIPIKGSDLINVVKWENDSMGELIQEDELYCNVEVKGEYGSDDYWIIIPLKDKK